MFYDSVEGDEEASSTDYKNKKTNFDTHDTHYAREEAIGFEDSLSHFVYVDQHYRRKRANSIRSPEDFQNNEKQEFFKVFTVASEVNEFFFEKLDHYSTYVVIIKACRKATNVTDLVTGSDDAFCSQDTQIIARTIANENADKIEYFDVIVVPSNKSTSDVEISWKPPKNPNGVVLNYVVKQKNVDDKNAKDEYICISLMGRENISSQIIDGMKPGNHSFQISAVSLAGLGNFTNSIFVYVPGSTSNFHGFAAFMGLIFLIVVSIIASFVYVIYKRNQKPEVLHQFENFDYENNPINN